MAKLNDLEKQEIIRFSKLLKKILTNKELLNSFLNYLQPINNEGNTPLVISNNMVAFKYPNGDTYSLRIDGSQIESYFSQTSIGAFQKITISYLSNIALVSVDETITEIDELTSLPSYILRRTDKKVYRDNELVYHRTYKTRANSSLNSYTCETSSQETYVSDDRIAYIRNIIISNDEHNIPNITYSKSVAFNPAPFNNLVNTEERSEPFVYPSNENEFITSTRKITNPETLQKK